MSTPPTTDPRPYERRQADAGPLRIAIWAAVKDARDDAFSRMTSAQSEYEHLNALLWQMNDAGMADHLPTIEEVQDAVKRSGGLVRWSDDDA
jgi:hypothetical protein